MRIRTSLALMSAAILLPVLSMAGLALYKIQQYEREALLRGLSETARATALIVDREVQGSLSALQVLGDSEHLQTRNFEAFHAQASALNRPDTWFLLLDPTGAQVLNTAAFGTPAPPAGAQTRVARVLASRQPLVTDVFVGPATGKLLTTVYVPARAGGGASFVVAQGFAVDYWKNTAMTAELPPDWIVAVIDRAGKFISRSHKTAELLGQPARPELVAAAAADQDGLIRHQTVEGIESYDAFTHSDLTGWTVAVAAPVRSIEAAALGAMRIAWAGAVLALVVAVLAAIVLGRHFANAVDHASQVALSLGRGRKPVWVASGIVEVDALNQALLDASELLDQERSSRLAAQLERQRLLENETRAREAAQAQDQAKDRFMAMLGHELRNPLAAISGAITLIATGRLQQAHMTRYVNVIKRQNQHLARIVDDLLDVTRLLAGKLELRKQPLDLAQCVRNCAEDVRLTAAATGYTLSLRTEDAWVDGDPVRIEQILVNLITNAIKFSPAGGHVSVELRAEPHRAVVTVRDAGAGIRADLLPHIFDPFVQGPPVADRLQAGLGIGLALVRQLVELHGGAVHAASDGVDQGSTFTVWLPLVAAPQDVRADPTAPAGTASATASPAV